MRFRRARGRCRWAVPAALALTALGSAHADDANPPARVAELSYVEGAVALEPAGMQEWTAAERNRPLTTGDRLWTDQQSVAELDLGDAVLRLGGMTGFAFLNLDDRFAQIQLSAGILIVHVRNLSAGQSYEIDTPNLAVSLQQPGVYRVEVDEPGDTTLVKVSDGQALALGSGETIPIPAPQVMVFSGSTTLSYSAASLGPPDDLDTWSATRDSQEEESPSRQYVADDTPGSYELDDNGRWQSTPDYGYVWTPAVVTAAWVPYRFGHWVWIAPWGWTWVDDAPWGYATSHYGRWVRWGGAWCWLPGPQALRPMYAPALVAWAHGPGFVPPGAAAANIGWFPLGPHELYAANYRVSDGYLRSLNLAGTTLAPGGAPAGAGYVNGTAGAITQVTPAVFTSAQRIAGHALPVTAATLTAMRAVASAPAVMPSRQSVLGGAAGGGRAAHAPPALANRAVVARAAPPPAPAALETQLAAMHANGGWPLARAELARLQPGIPTAQVRPLAGVSGAPQLSVPARADRPPWARQRPLVPAESAHPSSPPPLYQSDSPQTPVVSSAPPPRTSRAPSGTPPSGSPPPRTSGAKRSDDSHKSPHEQSSPHADRAPRDPTR